ncbi:MAG TPA: hypothetical protein VEW03_03690 [Longimicrobiaceae bacterium]|nr:hypothetical protein [Longimicrobiaceae bacterium]
MAIQVRCSHPDELDRLVDLVHDQWFELDEITYDQARGEVTIPFAHQAFEKTRGSGIGRLFPGTRVSVHRAAVRVRSVTALEIRDTERIGTYQFNDFTYEPGGVLRVRSSIPLGLTIHVTRLDASVEVTDEVATSRASSEDDGGD